jgi:hypothetical protein
MPDDLFFIQAEGEDLPHPLPVCFWGGSEDNARILSDALQLQAEKQALSLTFSYVRATKTSEVLALETELESVREGEYGELAESVFCRAKLQKEFLTAHESIKNKEAVATASPAAPPAANPPGTAAEPSAATGAGKAKLSPRELADKYGVGSAALRGRLDRWRYEHDAGYVEVSNPKRNEPKYLYDESAVMPLIEALKAKSVGRKRATDVQQKKV